MKMKLDQYFTPPFVIYAALPALAEQLLGTGLIIDPSAGDGRVLRCLYNAGVDPARLLGLEIDPSAAAQSPLPVAVADTLQTDLTQIPAVQRQGICLVLGNPPYSHAEDFVRWGIKHVGATGRVHYLLRTGFLGSVTRHPLFTQYPPNVTYLPSRPSFIHKLRTNGSKSTSDQYTYCWYDYQYGKRRPVQWVDCKAQIKANYLATGLRLPYDFDWKYTPPLVSAQGEIVEGFKWHP